MHLSELKALHVAALLKMGEDLLTFSRKANGQEHPDTLKAMHNLALSYGNVGRPEEALKLQEAVLAVVPVPQPKKKED